MNALRLRWRGLILAVMACMACRIFLVAADEPTLSKDQIKQFLLTAKVVKSKQSDKGITNPWRLTLSDGTITHDASFQKVDEHKINARLGTGTEMNFVDSYKYNIAAYTLAEMLDMDSMLPVDVERRWQGDPGSLSWWLPVKMDEVQRHRQNIAPPDPDAWNNQMYKIRAFDQLVYDSDANLTNVLIGENWQIWRVDFTRAFRLFGNLKSAGDLEHCDRHLLEKLKALDGKELQEKTKHYLTKDEVKAVMQRRDKIVEQLQQVIAQKGEAAVLY
jgi:hypothetical protein